LYGRFVKILSGYTSSLQRILDGVIHEIVQSVGYGGLVHPDLGNLSRKFQIDRDALRVRLRVREFDILEFLARHPGEVIARDKFCDDLWGAAVYVSPLRPR
jgi:DNA-binding response OmpR family regulator